MNCCVVTLVRWQKGENDETDDVTVQVSSPSRVVE